MFGGDESAHLVDVECVFSRELVFGTLDELQLVQGNANHLQHFYGKNNVKRVVILISIAAITFNNELIPLDTNVQLIPIALHVVQISVKIREQDRHLTTSYGTYKSLFIAQTI